MELGNKELVKVVQEGKKEDIPYIWENVKKLVINTPINIAIQKGHKE